VISQKCLLRMMRCLNVDCLRRTGDMVIDCPPTHTEFVSFLKPETPKRSSRQYGHEGMGTYPVPANCQLYVFCVDVGLLCEQTTRRVQTRMSGPAVDVAAGKDLAKQMVEVMERAMAHVRLLDYHAHGCERPTADSPEERYDVAIWICDMVKVNAYRIKNAAAKADHTFGDQWQEHKTSRHSWNDGDWSTGYWKRNKWDH
jgi:hypothetical protein